ncbi:hypothetical protein [Mesorhizobium sp. ES1-1]|uniref:hypothetical protein n=1 Tax=Mesorhizobium sp. ES1-1 TaxID=2876629 RepID=UPI001CCEF5FD|nr:hypothetical protein [Mesorhizobium sp. ES1-1]MBZ9675692.1 hypothetical protein [Mesorhizobium sp. ES1-1]
MKELRGLLAELSSNWLKRRKTQAPRKADSVKAASAVKQPYAEHKPRPRPAHKPKPISTRDVASNM